jgi:anti-sigma B factor antagonist
MTIHVRALGDVMILDVEGRITVQEGAATLRDAISRLLDDGQPRILVNLTAVPYIDSTALGELVRGYTSAARRGGALKLLQPAASVQQLLTITGLAGPFECFASEAEAVASFRRVVVT